MRILVVEDEVKIRKGIASLIGRRTEHTVIGEISAGCGDYGYPYAKDERN